MMEQISERERQRTLKLAEEYRGKGYEVIVSPTSEHLPDFLSGYHPDLLVKKGNEALIVEVKTRTSLTKNSQVRDLARLLQARPGWKFDLVLVSEVVVDNAPIHTSEDCEEELDRWQQDDRHIKVLPPSYPEFNLIERLWRKIQ